MSTSIDGIRSLTDLLAFSHNSKGKVSFWGTRYIQVERRNETFDIDFIAEKVMKIIPQCTWNTENRDTGRLIATEVNRIYEECDSEVTQNPITYLFVFLRTLPGLIDSLLTYLRSSEYDRKPYSCSQVRWNWKDCESYQDEWSNTRLHGAHKIFEFNRLNFIRNPAIENCKYIALGNVNIADNSVEVYAY